MNPGDTKALLDELQALKKLMVLSLFEKGFTQKQIGLTLGITQGTVSKMFPAGVLKRRGKEANSETN